MQSVLVQYDLKDEDALKETLKKANYPYDDFIRSLEDETRVQLFAGALRNNVKVTNQDVENQFVRADLQHILIQVDPAAKDGEKSAQEKANQIYQKIKQGMDFNTAAKAYSDDSKTKENGGHLGWISGGHSVPEFETVAFSLEKGEISRPIRTPFGIHIIKMVNKQYENRPISINYESEKQKLLATRQNQAVESYLHRLISQHKLKITNPNLQAYYAKINGETDQAISAYHTQSSLNTYDPAPHYLLFKLYKKIGDPEKAYQELQKAVLKGQLVKEREIPMAHVEMGKIYAQRGAVASRNEEYDAALASAQGQLILLKQLENVFKELGDSKRSNEAGGQAARLEAAIRANQTAQQQNQPSGVGAQPQNQAPASGLKLH
ncbi:hypothetical protein EBR96_07585 [bacterium]|nr:hypothetical protein [bacterium]